MAPKARNPLQPGCGMHESFERARYDSSLLMGLQRMQRILIVAVAAVLSTQCHAQQGGPNAGQCEQVRSAIEQYGLAAARKHAMANYNLSPADLRRVEQECGIGNRTRQTKR